MFGLRQVPTSSTSTYNIYHMQTFPAIPILNIFFRKFQGLVLGYVGYVDVKGIDLAQPIWFSGCLT